MNYLTIKEVAEKWGISNRAVNYHITDGRISGVIRKGNMLLIPMDAEKPEDRRYKSNKRQSEKRDAGTQREA